MPRLLLFNPGHEESLRHRTRSSYTPPVTVRRMTAELYPLMTLLAQEGDYIARLSEDWRAISICTHALEVVAEPAALPPLELWLWALDPILIAHVGRLAEGIGLRLHLPKVSEAYLALSHRSATCALLAQLRGELPHAIPEWLTPWWLYPTETRAEATALVEAALARFAEVYPARELIVKRPYTSSGRGVQPYRVPLSREQVEQLVGTLQREGVGLSFEPRLNVQSEWAMLYQVTETGEVVYYGLSHFVTAGANGVAYGGNVLAAEAVLMQRLAAASHWSLDALEGLKQAHARWLSQQLSGRYVGFVGIDMLVYSDEAGHAQLHPAVEVNVRCTMGVLAHALYARYGAKGEWGILRLDHCSPSAPQEPGGRCVCLTEAAARLHAYALLRSDTFGGEVAGL